MEYRIFLKKKGLFFFSRNFKKGGAPILAIWAFFFLSGPNEKERPKPN
jgi:hypothetical protein